MELSVRWKAQEVANTIGLIFYLKISTQSSGRESVRKLWMTSKRKRRKKKKGRARDHSQPLTLRAAKGSVVGGVLTQILGTLTLLTSPSSNRSSSFLVVIISSLSHLQNLVTRSLNSRWMSITIWEESVVLIQAHNPGQLLQVAKYALGLWTNLGIKRGAYLRKINRQNPTCWAQALRIS